MGRWNPWAALRRRERARLRFATVHPSGQGRVEVASDGTEWVYLDHRLGRVERNAVLGHELIHLERGVPHVGCPQALRDKEEATVRQITAERLVPPGELAAFVRARTPVGPVTVSDVCEEFDVPRDVAEEACRRLRWAN